MPHTQGSLLTQVLVLGAGVAMFFNGAISLGTFVAFSSLLLRLSKDFYKVTEKTIPELVLMSAVFSRLDEILAAQPQIVDPLAARPLPRLEREIRFVDVSFGYDGSVPQLDRVTLSIPAGTWVGLVGPSGAGKTTLLRLLLRLYDPVRGRSCWTATMFVR